MGYSLSRLTLESDHFDPGNAAVHGVGNGQTPNKPLHNLEHEVAQLTKLRSAPNVRLTQIGPRRRDLPVSTVRMLAGREGNYSGRGGRFSSADRCHVLSRYLPVNGPWFVDRRSSRAYVSQFSADGSLFIAGFQVYARMSPIVHMVDVGSSEVESRANITEIHEGLDFSSGDDGGYSFGIFSIKFSTDGHELVAGSSDDSIYVYDLEANKLSLRIPAHSSDVNTVCFSDESGHLIYSGSDDTLCKVWDRRCFNTTRKPAGVLTGHLEGIAFIDSKGDGRYFISNGKDQTIKLWDIRKMSSSPARTPGLRSSEWDYRWMDYPPQAKDMKHPSDQSVATYRGHSVLRTLIRCYFSPAYSTGQKYIYTGSHNCCVYIYDLVTGAQVATLKYHKAPVRDCSWHPYYPMLVSSSWDGTVAKWEFPGSGEAPASLYY
ncbi:LEC14B homolog isoform X4 [Pyrus x bretschneideri]|uniref:LEC14B homolog isoform X4 n=1 Tax=Pyrus x bretschneideri TaxID=225117 RepID=UPI0020304747|nr:LEC14B homolog isoform X4 [Pyrus x bretschneideri]